jgi:hypothetical protein
LKLHYPSLCHILSDSEVEQGLTEGGPIEAILAKRAKLQDLRESYPRIYPKQIRLAREYRCLGGILREVMFLITNNIMRLKGTGL